MLKNYLKIAFRSLKRDIGFSIINVLGLALGIACSLLIFLWAQNERGINNFHANGKRLFAVYERQYTGNQISAAGYFTPPPLPPEIKRVIPEVEYASGFSRIERLTFQVGDKIQKLEGTRAGEDFFKMFSYKLLQGTPESALSSPTGIAISRRMADVFFGSPENAIGKPIRLQDQKDLTVTAVFEDLPPDASDKFDYLLNWEAWLKENPFAVWESNGPRTYVQLRADADPARVEKKIENFLAGYNKNFNDNFRIQLGLQPFNKMYLYSRFENGKPTGGRIEYVRLFTGVAIFILLIACINFMNLATARSIKRAQEVGVRKVLGATRSGLRSQFIGEALLLTFFASVIALVLAALLLPAFNNLTGKQIVLPVFRLNYWLVLLGLLLLTGLVAGSYPAFFMSALNPIKVLKGAALRIGTGAIGLRKALVIFQFILSIALIISTLVVSRQMNYLQTKNLGFDRENLLYITLEGSLPEKYGTFKQEALNMPGIKAVDRISQPLHNMGFLTEEVTWEGKDPTAKILFAPASVGYDFVKMMNLKILQGRDFSRSFAVDTLNFLINEVAAEKMGFDNPVGKFITVFQKKGQIIGILKNFHFNSLHNLVQPLVLDVQENLNFGTALIRTQPGKTREAIASLEKVCRELNPKVPFTFTFADEEYQKLYKSEMIITRLSNIFAFLAIFISCLGLLGLSAFSAEQRTREIGIRKVLGASEANIVVMFSKDFMLLISVSFVLAALIAWFMMHKWLQGFAYRVDLSWWIFIVAGLLALIIALITVSFHATRAAQANPVKALRSGQ